MQLTEDLKGCVEIGDMWAKLLNQPRYRMICSAVSGERMQAGLLAEARLIQAAGLRTRHSV